MCRSVLLLALVLVLLVPCAAEAADTDPDTSDANMYYVVDRNAMVYRAPNRSTAFHELTIQDPVWVIEENGRYLQVETEEGEQGYIDKSAVSNIWIRVSKRSRTVTVYRGTEIHRRFPADFGYNLFADKERRGSLSQPDHWRTPEGVFYVAMKNPESQYYRGLLLNYPTIRHAERGLSEGLISEEEFEAIVSANENVEVPPMNTELGGWILIHGDGTGSNIDWTQGCVAVMNEHIDAMWDLVEVGTPVVIDP